MPAPDPTETISNWDFSAVLELLNSPAYTGCSAPARHSDSPGFSSFPEGQSGHDVSQPTAVKPQRSYPKLGDLGTVWDFLNQTGSTTQPNRDEQGPSPAVTILKRSSNNHASGDDSHAKPSSRSLPVSKASKPRVSKDTVSGSSLHSATRSEAITILKRASDSKPTKHNASVTSHPPRTPPKAIPRAGSDDDTPKVKSKTRAGRQATNTTKANEIISSESSAEVDSDSSTIIFDRTLTKKPGVLAFVPAQVGTLDANHTASDTPPSSYDDPDSSWNFDSSGTIRVRPAAYKSTTERRVGLMTKLLKEFPDYAKLVSQVGRSASPSKRSPQSRPIHVFVDMSNVRFELPACVSCPCANTPLKIMVGFHDSVKASRNIPISSRIRRVHMSFVNLSLILERGRPVSKRVLVGSDRLPSINEATTLGYEANILNRVHKAKHPSTRPSKPRKVVSGGPETATTSGERCVEQGVDEILHLKILESLLDTDEPATIVLASGDAAEAEFSGGFMRMVERALQRGWIVELVSFSQVTSNAYRRKEFREKWRSRFRLVELDGYIEELFD
ncbi:hypothetical protein N7474_006503 [Penicillium riverlandense]|uniref:uncharacterized protein n=1 Tax=Penicillium riverlandense TaxID=1903569 RepID=UPI0025475A1A|nr:uncharacterized protein N7474_006503 [Penicillium riverlandense]KAJ5814726.1 hypothetical protein N7474_006503 [Penicillium riverlandense]